MNDSALIARAKETRRSWYPVSDSKRLRLEAMTDGAFRRFCQTLDGDVVDLLPARVVVGWDGFTESDIDPHGSDEPLKFSAPLFAEWMDSHQEHLVPLFDACWAACKDSQDRLAQITEKPKP